MRSVLQSKSARVMLATGLSVSGLGVALVGGATPAQAASCGYFTTDTAQVRETPSINSVVRKTKGPGEFVTGPCATGYGTDGRIWTAVDCTCATDNIGFIISSKLRNGSTGTPI